MEKVILVDKKDNQIGVEEKLKAHQDSKLHRAFSIFIFNAKGELLLQQRASTKYHTPSLWTNTCCSHPRVGELIQEAAERRLKEEMGISCELKRIFSFIYKAEFDNSLTEYEYDHVFVGEFEDEPVLNPEEVDSYKWISIDELKKDVDQSPEKYTPWFKIILQKYLDKMSG